MATKYGRPPQNQPERRCGACETALPSMKHQGNPPKWCSGSCRAWGTRNPGVRRVVNDEGKPVRARVAPLERVTNCTGCNRSFVATRMSPRSAWPIVCSAVCRSARALAAGRAAQRALDQLGRHRCENPGCCADFKMRSAVQRFCSPRCRASEPENATKLREHFRAKNYHRRTAGRTTDITPQYERELRARAKRCPMPACNVRLTDVPFLPNSKELDHIVPINVCGTHTVGNVRIICRLCNQRRPKDGSDYTGPVTLWAEVA